MKDLKTRNSLLYIFNLALLITHEIDSAYWKEWDLFGMGGGIQGFLALNFILVIIGLTGLKQLIADAKSGYYTALFLSCGGIFAFVIHTYFIMAGHSEFTLPASVLVLVLVLLTSSAQIILISIILSGKKRKDTA
jgi:hypothetical protein